MSETYDKGKKYEEFSKIVLLLESISWDYSEEYKNIHFDKEFKKNKDQIEKIKGVSGQEHQIDVHLISKKHPGFHLICECKAHDAGVEKTHACSFITVIKDIKANHKNWKIIPVFTGESGFQPGAVGMLLYYKIVFLEMKDYRNITKSISTQQSIISPIVKNLIGKLDNDTTVNESAHFINIIQGGGFDLRSIIGFFELLDDNNQKIKDLCKYKGNFHTGKRIHSEGEYDLFIENKSHKKLQSIKGSVIGINTTQGDINRVEYSLITSIKLGDGSVYMIDKNGNCYRIDKPQE